MYNNKFLTKCGTPRLHSQTLFPCLVLLDMLDEGIHQCTRGMVSFSQILSHSILSNLAWNMKMLFIHCQRVCIVKFGFASPAGSVVPNDFAHIQVPQYIIWSYSSQCFHCVHIIRRILTSQGTIADILHEQSTNALVLVRVFITRILSTSHGTILDKWQEQSTTTFVLCQRFGVNYD